MWSADDSTLYAPFERRGTSYLAALSSTRSGEPAREISQGPYTLDFVRYNAGGHAGFYFARGDGSHPSEVCALAEPRGDTSEPLRRLTSVHEKWLAGRALSQPSRLQAKSPDGESVESWLYPPLGLEPDKRYPLIVYLHGGPEAFDGEYFDEGLENQIFPAAGFGVLRVNYRGSTSYGEHFSVAIRGDWHRREYDDILAALDEALRQPWVDGARLGIGGWSYGGIQTVWVFGHTDRFQAAAPARFDVDYLIAFGEDHWLAVPGRARRPFRARGSLPATLADHVCAVHSDAAAVDRGRGRPQLPAAAGPTALRQAQGSPGAGGARGLPRGISYVRASGSFAGPARAPGSLVRFAAALRPRTSTLPWRRSRAGGGPGSRGTSAARTPGWSRRRDRRAESDRW